MIREGDACEDYKFQLKKMSNKIGGYTVVLLNYDKNSFFKGDKLLVIRGRFDVDCEEFDPRMLNNTNVVAEFKPTKEGFNLIESLLFSQSLI